MGRVGAAGPGPAEEQTALRLQPRRISFLLYIIMSSSAGVTIIFTLMVLVFIITKHKHWYGVCKSTDTSQQTRL